MKKIVVACGTGMATSTIISEKIKELLNEHNIKCSITQCILGEIESHAQNADLIITSMKVQGKYSAPVVVGTAFLIGINEEMVKERILEILSN